MCIRDSRAAAGIGRAAGGGVADGAVADSGEGAAAVDGGLAVDGGAEGDRGDRGAPAEETGDEAEAADDDSGGCAPNAARLGPRRIGLAPSPVGAEGRSLWLRHVRLVVWMVPKGVSIARPPALGVPPGAVWQTAQSPSAASLRPRSTVASL